MIDFKRKKDSAWGGMCLIGQDEEKRVIIRKKGRRFLIVEFKRDQRMSEIMGEAYYDVKGEIVSDTEDSCSMAEMAEEYNLYENIYA